MREIKAVILTQEVVPTPAQISENNEKLSTIYCPRCQRPYNKGKGETYTDVMDRVKYHVSQQHPDHDPYWWDTYPDPDPNPTIKKR